ncbi:MAG: hypothetical protein ACRC92_21685 [Peptostreptococcaceae bacterium]
MEKTKKIDEITDEDPLKGTHWTNQEKQFLIENIDELSYEEISNVLNRTLQSIKTKALRLKLVKKKKETFVCKFCGIEFPLSEKWDRKWAGNVCSRECYNLQKNSRKKNIIREKKCIKCETVKPIADFIKINDVYRNVCRQCDSMRQLKQHRKSTLLKIKKKDDSDE